ncbi:MAG TPA: ABC transporter ATP-binding protein [Clostridiaceae bacterium]|nr:ABC transporter ATP-binding protein [Clostridiaceae bacterium]
MLRKLYTQYKWFVRDFSTVYLIATVTLLLNYVMTLIPPWAIGYLADLIISGQIQLNNFYNYMAILVVVIMLFYLTNYVWNYLLFLASDEISRAARRHLVTKYLKQSPTFFAKNSTGSLMGKATNDVDAIADMAGYGMMSFFDSTLYPLAVIFVMIFTVSWKLTLVAIMPLPLLIYSSKAIGKILYDRYYVAQQAFDEMNDKVLENIAGMRVIRAYNKGDEEIRDFVKTAQNLYDKNMSLVRMSAFFAPVARMIGGISTTAALSFGAILIYRQEISLGGLISFLFFLDMLIWPMMAVGEFINVSQQGSASMERIQEILSYEEDVKFDVPAVAYPGNGSIEFRDVSFTYPGAEAPSLCNINLELQPGETLGVVGKVGSGKTTLLKQLLRFYPQTEGKIMLGERPLETYSRSSLRRAIGYVPQQPFLFSRTIRSNIELGAPEGAELSEEKEEAPKIKYRPLIDPDNKMGLAEFAEVADEGAEEATNESSDEGADLTALVSTGISLEEAIDLADFRKDLEQLPDGLDTLAGEKGIALSGGQKQRITIARALMKGPEILILDDCLSAVDANTEETILKTLKAKRVGRTTLISSHRISAIMHADLIVVLDEGRIVESGTHQELLECGGWYMRQYERQKLQRAQQELK